MSSAATAHVQQLTAPPPSPPPAALADLVSGVEACAERLGDLVGSLDPAILQGSQAVALVEAFARTERLSSAGRTLAASAAQRSGSWKREGDRSAAHWMARKAGVPVGQAMASLETASRLDGLGQVESALRMGRLSVLQANEIASAAAADPTAQDALLVKASTGTLSDLRVAARKVRAAADASEVESYAAIHRRRYLRHWTDPDGAFRLDGLLTPDAGARLVANLDAWRGEVFKAARAAGVRESYDAYAVDALIDMAEAADPHAGSPALLEGRPVPLDGSSTASHEPTSPSGKPGPMNEAAQRSARRSSRVVINVHVDHAALLRVHTEAGETCEIPGVGPIPVAMARQMANDAFLKVLVTEGADIKAVAHAGRTIPSHVRTALENRDPTCRVPGCDARRGLEIDHIKPFAEGGLTKLENLARLCHWHHRQKTLGGWILSGGPGDWSWLPPP